MRLHKELQAERGTCGGGVRGERDREAAGRAARRRANRRRGRQRRQTGGERGGRAAAAADARQRAPSARGGAGTGGRLAQVPAAAQAAVRSAALAPRTAGQQARRPPPHARPPTSARALRASVGSRARCRPACAPRGALRSEAMDAPLLGVLAALARGVPPHAPRLCHQAGLSSTACFRAAQQRDAQLRSTRALPVAAARKRRIRRAVMDGWRDVLGGIQRVGDDAISRALGSVHSLALASGFGRWRANRRLVALAKQAAIALLGPALEHLVACAIQTWRRRTSSSHVARGVERKLRGGLGGGGGGLFLSRLPKGSRAAAASARSAVASGGLRGLRGGGGSGGGGSTGGGGGGPVAGRQLGDPLALAFRGRALLRRWFSARKRLLNVAILDREAALHGPAIRTASFLMRWRRATRRTRGAWRKQMRAKAFCARKLARMVWRGWRLAVAFGREQRRVVHRGRSRRVGEVFASWAHEWSEHGAKAARHQHADAFRGRLQLQRGMSVLTPGGRRAHPSRPRCCCAMGAAARHAAHGRLPGVLVRCVRLRAAPACERGDRRAAARAQLLAVAAASAALEDENDELRARDRCRATSPRCRACCRSTVSVRRRRRRRRRRWRSAL